MIQIGDVVRYTDFYMHGVVTSVWGDGELLTVDWGQGTHTTDMHYRFTLVSKSFDNLVKEIAARENSRP